MQIATSPPVVVLDVRWCVQVAGKSGQMCDQTYCKLSLPSGLCSAIVRCDDSVQRSRLSYGHDAVHTLSPQTSHPWCDRAHFVRTDPWVTAQTGKCLKEKRAYEREVRIEIAWL